MGKREELMEFVENHAPEDLVGEFTRLREELEDIYTALGEHPDTPHSDILSKIETTRHEARDYCNAKAEVERLGEELVVADDIIKRREELLRVQDEDYDRKFKRLQSDAEAGRTLPLTANGVRVVPGMIMRDTSGIEYCADIEAFVKTSTNYIRPVTYWEQFSTDKEPHYDE